MLYFILFLLHINVAVMSHKCNATALQNTQVSVEHNRQSNGVTSSVTCKHKDWLLMLQKRLHYYIIKKGEINHKRCKDVVTVAQMNEVISAFVKSFQQLFCIYPSMNYVLNGHGCWISHPY